MGMMVVEREGEEERIFFEGRGKEREGRNLRSLELEGG